MKLLGNISNIFCMIENKNKCYIFGNSYCGSSKTDYNLSVDDLGKILLWKNKILISGKEFGEIKVFDESFNILYTFLEGMNLNHCFITDEGLNLPSRISKSFWRINDDLTTTNLNFIKNYHRDINGFVFNINLEKSIEVYKFGSEIPLWQIDTSQYRVYKEPLDERFIEHPNKIDGPIFRDENTVYVPMKGGQLVALNFLDGSLKWILEMTISCFYVIYQNKIYGNNGDELFEIDAQTGEILRKLEYKSIKKLKRLFGFTGEHKVYKDYIILKDQVRGWVAMFDRKTMTLAHLAETGSRIGSDSSYFHWIDNKLYVLDRENTLHIFEI
jgi:outer membrane protein assembly factor BamB